jgi:membrane-associated phospholipid phosphatase
MRIVVIVLLLLPSLAVAQYDSVKRRIDPLRFADAVVNTYTSPIRWKGNDWLKVGTIVGSTALLTLADNPVRNFWLQQSGSALDAVHDVGYHYGKPYCTFMISGSLYAAGFLFKNEWARETGLALTTALVTSGLLEMGLKPLIGRARPGRGEGNYRLDFMNDRVSFHSFPSGHASMAFTVSFVMAKSTKNIPLKVFFYSLAGATTVCRLYADAHWISDVAFGAVLAWFCSEAALKRLALNKFRKPNKKTQWNLTPYPGGVTLRAKFN